MKDRGYVLRVQSELLNLSIDVAMMQETYLIFKEDGQVLKSNNILLSAFGYHLNAGDRLLIRRSLNEDINVVSVGEEGRLVVADVVV